MRHLLLLLLVSKASFGQIQEKIVLPNIKSTQLFMFGNQLGYPLLRLGGGERMELHFDDLDADVKNYYYTFQLCNADWTPAMLSSFDFISGFSQQRISNYRTSNRALTRYTHYQVVLPDRDLVPKLSGNYILKVYRDGDTSKLAFTKRFMVYEEKAIIGSEVQQPFNAQFFRTHQKLQFKVNTKNLQVVNAGQQINVTLLQNFRWDNAIKNLRPTFMTNNQVEYNTENDAVFQAGKEWRWLDLRSFRLQSDRVDSAHYLKTSTEIFVKPGFQRKTQEFNFYRDNNGLYYLENLENANPYWQSDYATVYFSYVPPGNTPFPNKELYVFGALTNYGTDPAAKMHFNTEKGVYEASFKLKQGYYDFCYATVDQTSKQKTFSFEETEGTYWETENEYTILVYYRALGGRYDQLAGVARFNSLTERPGRIR